MPLARGCRTLGLKRQGKCALIVSACLLMLGAKPHPTPFHIYGIKGDAEKNVQLRLTELSQRQNLSSLSEPKLNKQVQEALEPYGYFESKVHVNPKRKGLAIRITPGRQMRINRLSIRIEGEGASNPKLKGLIDTLPLKEGDPLLSKVYEETKEQILSAAEHEGYLFGSFSKAVILINKKKYRAEIELVFNTGSPYYFGQVQFDPTYLCPELLYRYVPFQFGQKYSTDQIITFNNQLSGSGYFKSVLVKPDIDSNQSHVPVNVHLTPADRYSYNVGIGYGTDTGPRGRLGFHMVPVNRLGHQFHAIAQGSTKENALMAQYTIPGRNPVTDQYALSASMNHLDYDTGLSNSFLLSAAQRHNTDNYQRIVSINGLFDNYYYTYKPRVKEFTLFPKLSYTFSKTTDPLFSPSGYNISLFGLGAYNGAGSKHSFAQAAIDAKVALTIDPIRTRFYAHGIQGYTGIDNINNLPLSLSMFLGGNDNLKAYSINSIGPGKIISYGGLEIQKETIDKWYVIGFMDAGDVYNPTVKNFKYDAGLALMWVSPVGPIKIGVAQAVDNRFQRLHGSHPKLVINMGPDLS